MLPKPEDLEARRLTWAALSSMFVDTDVSVSREWRSASLAASPYSLAEIEEILITEIYPVCWANLNSSAAEQAVFEPSQLESMILKRESCGAIYARLLALARVAIPHSREWVATKTAIEAVRKANTESKR